MKINYFAFLLFLTSFTLPGYAQQSVKKILNVGDPAPALTYAKWVQGPNPIKALSPDKTYVLEFWATWCAPCIAAMPHISELSKQYAGKVDFISCDVWETSHGGGKQENYLAKVEKFVKEQYKTGRLTYNVIADNNAQDMANNWLRAAGQDGIPCSFIVQKGQVAWIGHPVYLDSILNLIEQGKYNVNEVRDQKANLQKIAAQQAARRDSVLSVYKAAVQAKSYDKAITILDEDIVKYPEYKNDLITAKFMVLLDHYGEDKAIAYGTQVADDKDDIPAQILTIRLMERKDLSMRIKDFNASIIRNFTNTKEKFNQPQALNALAELEAIAGNYKNAVEAEKRALKRAEELKNDVIWKPLLSETTLGEFRAKLKEYEQKAAEKK